MKMRISVVALFAASVFAWFVTNWILDRRESRWQEFVRSREAAHWKAAEAASEAARTNGIVMPEFQFGPEDHPGFDDQTEILNQPKEQPKPKAQSKTQTKAKLTELQKSLTALAVVESKGNPNAFGDLHLIDKAYGLLQIRKPYLADVNRLFSSKIRAAWGKSSLSLSEMREPAKARWVAETYLSYYGNRYRARTGKAPDAVVYARIHNGGPDGWAESATKSHGNKVRAALAKMRL